MDLLKAYIFRAGFFKQVKYLVSTPQYSIKNILISESGIVSQELIPMQTGFVSADEAKKAWVVLHNLKFHVHKNGVPVDQDSVLALSERCYIPLDPLGTTKPKELEKLSSLKDIARLRHTQARSDMSKNVDQNTQISQLIINGSFVMLGIFAVVAMVRGCG